MFCRLLIDRTGDEDLAGDEKKDVWEKGTPRLRKINYESSFGNIRLMVNDADQRQPHDRVLEGELILFFTRQFLLLLLLLLNSPPLQLNISQSHSQ